MHPAQRTWAWWRLGERCGNANLISIIPSLVLKMGLKTGISTAQLEQLTHVGENLLDALR